MQRTERYKNVLRMIHRVHELQDAHRWTTAQFRKAMSLLDETHPFSLHLVGTHLLRNIVICNLIRYMQPSSRSSSRKPLLSYFESTVI